ncbi:hypothetical protein JRQ81_012609, partial [Phrynocephalus forsythii]
GLRKTFLEEFTLIKVMFLPPNTTALLQPMDHQVISSFKKLCTKELFRQCFEMMVGTSLTLWEYWRDYFDIVSCVRLINIRLGWDQPVQSECCLVQPVARLCCATCFGVCSGGGNCFIGEGHGARGE